MFSTCGKNQCGECGGADPVKDRVKVDPALLAGGKENAPPKKTLDKIADERKFEEERRRAEAAEEERKRIEAQQKAEEEARAAKAKAERQAAEERKVLQARLEEHRRLEEQARLEEEQRRLREEKEKALHEQQAQEQAEQEAARAADEAASQKVSKFLKDNSYSSVNCKKSSFMSHKYPLHVAVEKKDVEAIHALLHCKADPTLQNSSKKTPEQLARSKKGSESVLAVLMATASS